MLEVARKCLAAYATATKANDIPTAKAHERRMLQVWATFPSFCVAPVDLAASFTPSLGKTGVDVEVAGLVSPTGSAAAGTTAAPGSANDSKLAIDETERSEKRLGSHYQAKP